MSRLALDDLLAKMVATPSISGDEGALADWLSSALEAQGVEVLRLGHTLVAKRGQGGPKLLLLSHLDTVPVGVGWTSDPYAGHWTDGRLVGRGANDAKGCAAAMFDAFLDWTPPAPGGGELWFALTAQEETDNAGMRALLDSCARPDAVVCGEPTGLQVVRAQGGLAVLRASWCGRSCHAAHAPRVPHENALLRAARELAALPQAKTFPDDHGLLGESSLVATVMSSGDRRNVVPDHAEAWFDARLTPARSAEQCAHWLAERLPQAKIEVFSDRLRPIETAEDHPFVQVALRSAERSHGIGSSTLSDMALLQGVPAVKCGPGQTERSHTPDEFITRSELHAGARFYRRLAQAAFGALQAPAVGAEVSG